MELEVVIIFTRCYVLVAPNVLQLCVWLILHITNYCVDLRTNINKY